MRVCCYSAVESKKFTALDNRKKGKNNDSVTQVRNSSQTVKRAAKTSVLSHCLKAISNGNVRRDTVSNAETLRCLLKKTNATIANF